MSCPLCKSDSIALFLRLHGREYWRCENCDLIHVPYAFHLRPTEEEKRYRMHENISSDEAYRAFFHDFVKALSNLEYSSHEALDFGSGEDTALKPLLEKLGFKCQVYDPIFHPSATPLARTYPLVTCTEVIEHLREPAKVFQKLREVLVERGVLGLMTRLVPENLSFEDWHYPRDPTHICFWSSKTFVWLSHKLGFEILEMNPKFQILRLSKPSERR